jgi:hypothetical protein
MISLSGGAELSLDEGRLDLPSRESFEGFSRRSSSLTIPGTGGASAGVLSFFFRLRLAFRSLEIPLDPAFAGSGTSPADVLGRSKLEALDERSLLRPELSIASESAESVQARRDLVPWRLDVSESAMAEVRPRRAMST